MKQDPRIVIFLRRDFTLHTGVSASLYREIFRSWPYALIPGVHVCAEANTEVIEAQIKDVIKGDYDVAVTIGTLYSQMVVRRVRELASPLNVLCVAVKEPQSLGLIKSFEKPGGNVTAVVRDHAPVTQLGEMLMLVKPTLSRILIAYASMGDAGRINEDVDFAARFFERHRVAVVRHPFYRHDNCAEQIIGKLKKVDTVLLVEGGMLTEELLKLARACGDAGVTLCAADIDGVVAGAAISFGEDMASVGRAAHQQLLKILAHDGPAGDIPVAVIPNGRRLYVNKALAQRQGLSLESPAIFVLEHTTVIDEDEYTVTGEVAHEKT